MGGGTDELLWVAARTLKGRERRVCTVSCDASPRGGPTGGVGWVAERQDAGALRFLTLIDVQQS